MRVRSLFFNEQKIIANNKKATSLPGGPDIFCQQIIFGESPVTR
jgi:hypothetical protein